MDSPSSGRHGLATPRAYTEGSVMGQTIDLPDPLEKAAPLPAPSADELLAQLAGDEIDRLLAEADARPEPPPPAPAPAAPPASPNNKLVDPATDPELAMELDSLFNQGQPG